MKDHINRLTVYKKECERKEKLISMLQDQIGKLEVMQDRFFKNNRASKKDKLI